MIFFIQKVTFHTLIFLGNDHFVESIDHFTKDFQRSEIKLPMASDLMSGGELLDTRLTGFEIMIMRSKVR